MDHFEFNLKLLHQITFHRETFALYNNVLVHYLFTSPI